MVLLLLAIELLDELVFGAREAAWPLIRTDLNLSYSDIGLLLGIPTLLSALIEPVIGVIGDAWNRKVVILGGGLVFVGSLVLTALAPDFAVILTAFVLFSPASGAFVGLSQATLMDTQPDRREHNMARWTLAGGIGVVSGSLLLAGSAAGGPGWRILFLAFAAARLRGPRFQPAANSGENERPGFRLVIQELFLSLRRTEILRWLLLLLLSDLLLDVFLGFLALYFVAVVRADESQGALAVGIWTGASLVGNFLVIPFLEHVPGLRYVRLSAAVELLLFGALLNVPDLRAKLVILALVGLVSSGWYPVLKAQYYSVMPGRSGSAMALNSVTAPLAALIPVLLGFVAAQFGLSMAMWLFMLGPIALILGVRPRAVQPDAST